MAFHDKRVAHWVADRIDVCKERGFGECHAIGVMHNMEIIGGVVYHNWCPEFGTIEMSAASTRKRSINRKVLREIFDYPFSFCQMVIAQHDHDSPARNLWLRVGASEYVIPRLRGPETAGVIATLTKEAWQSGPFMKAENNGHSQGT